MTTGRHSPMIPVAVLVALAACAVGPGSQPPATSPTGGSRVVVSSTAPATPPIPVSTAPVPVSPAPAPTRGDLGGEVDVLSVTDGDTLRVLVDGENEPLRLIGINAPEEGECLAAEAATRLAQLVGANQVRLERDVSDRDDFGRLLRYVFAGGVFVNEALVREGLALARRYEPDVAHATRLEQAQAAAQDEGSGMWAADACGRPATGSIEIGPIHHDAAGDDNQNLEDEWVEFVNPGSTPVDLTGWSVKDESARHRYDFPDGYHLAGGASVRLHTGCGRDTSALLHWCNEGSAIWNNSGDTVFLLDPAGNIAASRSYGGSSGG